eukprot:123200-Prymnesium_polylepis.1
MTMQGCTVRGWQAAVVPRRRTALADIVFNRRGVGGHERGRGVRSGAPRCDPRRGVGAHAVRAMIHDTTVVYLYL